MKCQKRAAAVKLVRITGGTAHSIYLCEQCAAEISPYQKHASALQETIEKVLAQLVQKQSEAEETEDAEAGPPCPGCGTSYATYRKTFLLGCPQCYSAFEGKLEAQLKHLHGHTRHVGRSPDRTPKSRSDAQSALAALKKELAVAVSSEDFEKAAHLRDRIRQMQGGSDHVVPKMREV